ncbi:MAG: helix-turn-helix domain-containing protein, partial [Desulfovibrionaceae bacterium]|nr:helix-turn-helix domain-containing protein [Desulfovibrionaceae bacterium]
SGSTITREDVLQQLRQGRFSTPLPAGPEDHADHGAVRPFMGSEYGTGPAISAEAAGYGPVLRDEEEEDEDYEDDGLGEYEDEEAPQDFFVLGSGQSLEKALEQARDSKIMEAMNKARGNRNDAAALLGMSPNQLSYALQRIRNAEQNEGDEDDSD